MYTWHGLFETAIQTDQALKLAPYAWSSKVTQKSCTDFGADEGGTDMRQLPFIFVN